MRFLAAASVAALFLPAVAPAQTTTLTEAELLAPLTADHPALVALGGEVAAARAALVAARRLADPELSAVREDPAGAGEQLDLTLSWQPPHPGRRRLAVAAAEAEVAAAAARRDAELLDLELLLREVFARWAVASARGDGIRGHLGRVEALAARQRLRAEAGEVSGLEARRLELAAAELRASLAGAEAEAAEAEAAVRAWRPELPDRVRPALPELPEPAEAPAAGHPRLAALEAELAAARRSAELARRVVAVPELVGGWQRQEEAGGAVEGPIVGLVWPLPLFDRGRADRLRAEARAETIAARLELTRRRLAGERAGRSAAYRRLREAALEAGAAAAVGATAVEAADAAFRLGEADLTDLLETLRSATAAEFAALDLRAAALAAGRELARVTAATAPAPNSVSPFDRDHDNDPGDTP